LRALRSRPASPTKQPPNTQNLKIKPIDFQIAEKAAELRAKYGTKPPDTLQLGAALIEGAKAFVTNDEKLKQVEEIETIVMKYTLGIQ